MSILELQERILGATGRKVTSFDVSEWGFPVSVRSWSVAELQEYQAWIKEAEPTLDVLAKVAVRSLCDKDGTLLFNEQHTSQLAEKSLSALVLIAEKVMDLNGLSASFRNPDKK
jgi:hypothetical protein